ncbi:hypothetical protein HUK80_17750 [Flavobacterium sp. MAH-1]|uniref:Uncharacterized protein n=1 Tax=Flavobacterium agri TaxID=2743471 RepID=A0A7Y8Y5J1_9FLAO|nr:hypothetical protein [Flavobacterium agri]NUY82752.1 hypothetical protein [Flavobacterium agri]NYA72775.1 hypothetical protein [Flavobacterium agri]
MKYIFVSILLISLNISFSQNQDDNKIIIDNLLKDGSYGDGELRIIPKLEKKIVEFELENLKNNKEFFSPIDKSDRISITKEEQKKIIQEIQMQYGKTLDTKLFSSNKWISIDYIKSYLEEKTEYNNSNRVMMISKPVYIRNNTICVVYFMHLCCGSGGQTSLWFYKKENGNWDKWIPISQGLF